MSEFLLIIHKDFTQGILVRDCFSDGASLISRSKIQKLSLILGQVRLFLKLQTLDRSAVSV